MAAREAVIDSVVPVKALDAKTRAEMFALFAAHYDAVQRDGFESDLAEKDLVLLVRTESGALITFSTILIKDETADGQKLRYLYSGDTVTDMRYWGPGDGIRAWFRIAGSVKAETDRNLYWFLLVKGHRTYRLLDAFFHNYVPRLNRPVDSSLMRIRDELATRRFGEYYDASTGRIDFRTSWSSGTPSTGR